MEGEARLREIAQAVSVGGQRMVVRWIDEGRIVPAEQIGELEGFSVCHVNRVTLTFAQDGSAARCTIEGLALARIKQILSDYAVEVLYRSDNIT